MRFDLADGSKPTQSTVQTGALANPLEKNPVRDGFLFDGWTLNGQPFDFQTPILQDTTLTAKWTKVTDWTLSPDHGPASGARLTISPPDRLEPYYVSVQAAGSQILGLTGDGRIYTWTQDSTPKHVPFPAQAPDGFRYLQAASGSGWQAALGSDQRIYTWNNRQVTPTTLDTGRNTRFTSISINDDRLLAVDQQGKIHAFQASQKDTQNTSPKPEEQETISLPGKAQAVTAATSASQALIVDADGQAWTWNASKTRQAKPARVKQDPGIRTFQAQPLIRGFLLLDSRGQPWYLADSTTSPTAAGLPEGVQTSRITANKDQAIITSTDGHVWAWKADEAPKRVDDENQRYMQAVKADSRITAIDRQGDMFTWNLDPQNNPGKPARLDTTQAPTLETASMDGQPLKPSMNNGSWQADIPAHNPGPAAITITSRQDGQPFTRSLAYTVDQPPARAAEPGSTLTVRFDTGGGSPKPADQTVPAPYGRAKRPSPDPVREGFLFDGWFTGEVAYDFSRPVDKDLTLAAHWTPASRNTKWSISPDKGSQLGRESTTITPPDNASRGIRFSQISGSMNNSSTSYGFSLAVGSDGNAYAWGYNGNGQLGDGTGSGYRTTPVMVRTPDRNTYPDLPKDFTYLQVSAGQNHSLALGSDGNAYAWGYNGNGQLGDGTSSDRNTPVRVKTPDRSTYPDLPKDFTYLQVSAGGAHSLALGSDGNAYAWGSNSQGQLGDGTTTDRYTPVRVKTPAGAPGDFTYLQVSAGRDHSLAVGSDGYTYAWGCNLDGQLGNSATSDHNANPVRVRDPASPKDKSKGLKAAQVSGGYHHSLAIGSDGNAYAWGYNYAGQLGDGTASTKLTPVPVSFNLQLVITGVRFDQTPVSGLTRGDGNSVSVLTPAHQPGTVTVSVDYTLGGAPQTPDTSLRYTYLPAGVLPRAGGEGILLALATGMTGMGGVLASRRHRQETRQLSHASHE
ncbi:InlB B-repeat-containing protein [Bifidobacterium apousia]|uniref:RCC1 domain-containing protein n=1 Tax=Bifidobacterium apousia TaxID=2750996 RepID=UPI0018DBF364|nr:InlB B-repeat-containing protein [Bifidobacterium apousia]